VTTFLQKLVDAWIDDLDGKDLRELREGLRGAATNASDCPIAPGYLNPQRPTTDRNRRGIRQPGRSVITNATEDDQPFPSEADESLRVASAKGTAATKEKDRLEQRGLT
jgi:hypothetical protein